MSQTINNYADLQNLLNSFVSANALTPALAPHGVFWETMSYDQFVTGSVLGQQILVKGDSKNSFIIQILTAPTGGFDQMPQPSPPYNNKSPKQADVITSIANWIDAGCPN
jgi:hypothetical protein